MGYPGGAFSTAEVSVKFRMVKVEVMSQKSMTTGGYLALSKYTIDLAYILLLTNACRVVKWIGGDIDLLELVYIGLSPWVQSDEAMRP